MLWLRNPPQTMVDVRIEEMLSPVGPFVTMCAFQCTQHRHPPLQWFVWSPVYVSSSKAYLLKKRHFSYLCMDAAFFLVMMFLFISHLSHFCPS